MELTCGKQCPCWQAVENAYYNGVCHADLEGPFYCDKGEECDVTADDLELWLRETEARAKMLQAAIAALREARGDALLPNNVPSSWCWGGEKGKCTWLDIGLDGAWPDAEHKCTCPDRCCEGSWFKEAPPHA